MTTKTLARLELAKKISCGDCYIPVAEIVDGVIVIRSKHWGNWHETRISLVALDKTRGLVVT